MALTIAITTRFTGEKIDFINPFVAPSHRTQVSEVNERKAIPEPITEKTPVAEMLAPSQDFALNQIRENELEVCMGVSTETGMPYIQDLIDGTHYKFIGASGMGKSCMAGSILDQATKMNDPRHLQIALLDLEHKTSRLFEHLPHIAELNLGRKRVNCVATTPDEVGEHLGYLHLELDRRKQLSEYDLARERFMLIYLEEFVSLKYEIDPDLLDKMYADFSILALRGRKYGLYLLACAQVDYASKIDEMKEAQNQFNVKGSFSVKPSAARAAGFNATNLLNKNFQTKQPGKFVLEATGVSDLLLAPRFDVRAKVQQLDMRSGGVQRPFRGPSKFERSTMPDIPERHTEARSNSTANVLNVDENRLAEMQRLDAMGWTKQEVVEKVWNCKKGGSKDWQEGSQIYDAVIVKKESRVV